MLKLVVAAIALVLGVGSAEPTKAQTTPYTGDIGSQREMRIAPLRPGAERMQQFESVRRLNQNSPAAYERIRRRAQSLLAASNTSCNLVNAVELGRTERRRDIIEVSCASGLGYILVSGTPPTVFDCLQIAQVARRVRRDNPRADVGSQCTLAENGGAS